MQIVKIWRPGTTRRFSKALVVPDRIKLTEHLLSRYANANLRAVIPTNLDIVLVHYLAGFYAEVTDNPLGFLAGCQGLYICQDHIWMPRRDATEVLRTLKEQCDLDVSEAILLPLGRIRYWTYVHESLHVIFNHLTPEQREAIIESARRSYASVFDMEGSIPFTLNLETSYDDYTWDGLTPRSRLRLVDELIACSFTHSSMNCPSKTISSWF